MVRTDAIKLLEKEQFEKYNLLEFRKDAPNEIVLKKMGNRYFVYETNEKGEQQEDAICCLTEEEGIEKFLEHLYAREGLELPDSLY